MKTNKVKTSWNIFIGLTVLTCVGAPGYSYASEVGRLIQLGDGYERQQKMAQAEQAFLDATKSAKDDTEQEMALQRLCKFYEAREQLDEKIGAWENEAKARLDDRFAPKALVVALYNVRRDLTRALPWLERLCDAEPKNEAYCDKLARCYADALQFEKAAQHYLMLSQKVQDNRQGHYEYLAARSLLQAGSLDEARDLLQKMEEKYAQNPALLKKIRELQVTP